MLVLREVMAGQERFNDIRANLPGIAPGVLTGRLRTLKEQGLLATEGNPNRPRYVITERGREALPVMRALAKFGMPLLDAPKPTRVKRPWSAVQSCLIAFFDPRAVVGVEESYQLVVNGEVFVLTSHGMVANSEDAQGSTVLTLTTTAATLFAIRKELLTLQEAIQQGDIAVKGSKEALNRFRRQFALS
jgi:DNA-binding HxlR family transcriptional regulator